MNNLKKIFEKVHLGNYQWEKILAVHFYQYEKVEERKFYSLRSGKYGRITLGMIRFYLRELFQKIPAIEPNAETVRFLFFKSLPRADYDEFFLSVSDAVQNHSCRVYNGISYADGFNKRTLFLAAKNVRVLYYLIRKLGSHAAFYYYTKMINYLNVAQQMAKHHPEVVVVFADMHPMDNMLVQHFRQLGRKTVTFQHGLYVDYGTLPTVNVLNYTNSVAQNFLAWGRNTADLITKYHPETKTFICGKPTRSEHITPTAKSAVFTVLFDQKMYASYNQRLLDIAQVIARDHNWKVALRLHPTTHIKDYSFDSALLHTTEQIPWEEVRFCLGHSTSLIYELLRKGMPVYQLKSEIPCHPLPEDLRFESAQELTPKLEMHADFEAIGKHYVELTGEESLREYEQTLLKL